MVKDIRPGPESGAYGYSYGLAEVRRNRWRPLLQRRRRHQRHRTLEIRRHSRRHPDGQGCSPGRTSYDGYGSNPTELTAVGSTLYFSADDGTNGRQLWKSDGTADGTELVKDIGTGGAGGGYNYGSRPRSLTAVGSTLYFSADDGTNGTELWKSDGTAAGTQLVKDIRPGISPYFPSYSSSPSDLTAVGSTLFFSANDGTNGRELWKSDGTTAGTQLVKDIQTGAPSSISGYGYRPSSDLTAVGKHPLLQRQRRHQRPRTLEVRRNRQRHPAGQGHPAGQQLLRRPLLLRQQLQSFRPRRGRQALSTSAPAMAPTAANSGSPTAAPAAPSWSRTSGRAAAPTAAPTPTATAPALPTSPR